MRRLQRLTSPDIETRTLCSGHDDDADETFEVHVVEVGEALKYLGQNCAAAELEIRARDKMENSSGS